MINASYELDIDLETKNLFKLKVAFFRRYDAFFSFSKNVPKTILKKRFLKLVLWSQLTLTALQCPRAEKFKSL